MFIKLNVMKATEEFELTRVSIDKLITYAPLAIEEKKELNVLPKTVKQLKASVEMPGHVFAVKETPEEIDGLIKDAYINNLDIINTHTQQLEEINEALDELTEFSYNSKQTNKEIVNNVIKNCIDTKETK